MDFVWLSIYLPRPLTLCLANQLGNNGLYDMKLEWIPRLNNKKILTLFIYFILSFTLEGTSVKGNMIHLQLVEFFYFLLF